MAAIYSIFIVDRATHFYNLDCHDTAPIAKVIKYPNVDLLLSMSLAISASIIPSKTIWDPPKHKHMLNLPFKYLKIHFTVSHYSFSRLDKNLLTTPTTWAIFGLVYTITHIKLPTAKEYGIHSIFLFSSSEVEQHFLLNLKWLPREELTCLVSFILYLSSNLSIYLCWDNNFLEFRSHVICIPKICLAPPRSFI